MLQKPCSIAHSSSPPATPVTTDALSPLVAQLVTMKQNSEPSKRLHIRVALATFVLLSGATVASETKEQPIGICLSAVQTEVAIGRAVEVALVLSNRLERPIVLRRPCPLWSWLVFEDRTRHMPEHFVAAVPSAGVMSVSDYVVIEPQQALVVRTHFDWVTHRDTRQTYLGARATNSAFGLLNQGPIVTVLTPGRYTIRFYTPEVRVDEYLKVNGVWHRVGDFFNADLLGQDLRSSGCVVTIRGSDEGEPARTSNRGKQTLPP